MKVYDYSLDFNDGSANGMHVYGTGLASGEAVELAVKTALAPSPAKIEEPYYEFNDAEEKTGGIFVNEAAARKAKPEPIGKFSIREIPN